MTKPTNTLGNGKLANGEIISFPKHLTPEIIHSALFISNADDKETAGKPMPETPFTKPANKNINVINNKTSKSNISPNTF